VFTRLRKLIRDERGVTALEFAFVAPIFISIMLSIFQFGWAQHKLSSVRFAMEMVARQVQLNPAMTQAQVSTAVKAKLADMADDNVTITLVTNTVTTGKVAVMTGTYTSEIGLPYVLAFPINWTTTVSTNVST
jgi:Flp pilus assembly protein TadG